MTLRILLDAGIALVARAARQIARQTLCRIRRHDWDKWERRDDRTICRCSRCPAEGIVKMTVNFGRYP